MGATNYSDEIDEERLFTNKSASRLSSEERALSSSELSGRSASREREVRSPFGSKESGGAASREREDSETCGSKDSDGAASKENEALQKQPPASQPSAEDMKKQREALLEAQVKHEREILAKFEQGALARWTGSKDTKRSKKEGKEEKKEKKKKHGKQKEVVMVTASHA